MEILKNSTLKQPFLTVYLSWNLMAPKIIAATKTFA
jgi:hypothetical protein